jgi:hypothetical protein
MSQDFWKFMVHDFLKINVPRFFEIHSPRFFGIQCPTIFCDFGLFNSLAQAGGGGPYYMIIHYQKHTVLNYYHPWPICLSASGLFSSPASHVPKNPNILSTPRDRDTSARDKLSEDPRNNVRGYLVQGHKILPPH